MSRRTFYRLGLVAPYFLPLVALLLWGVLDKLPDFLTTILGFAFFSAFIWAIPYLPVVIGLFFWSRGKPDAQIRRAFLLAPLLLAAILAVSAIIFSEQVGGMASALTLAGLALLIGFTLVALWLCLELLLARLGVF